MESEALLLTMLQSGLAHCTVVVQENGSFIISLFLAGLLGSSTHCTTMCAPFVLSQVSARLEHTSLKEMSEFKRLTGAALLPYHFGRLTTYCILGTGAGFLAQGVVRFDNLKWFSAVLLVIAAFFFLSYALKKIGIAIQLSFFTGSSQKSNNASPSLLSRMTKPLFSDPVGIKGYILGALLGFLPCGLLYGALALAGASADPLAAAFGMVAFAFGTVPALLIVALFGHLAARKWQKIVSDLSPILLILNAVFLLFLAWKLSS